MWAFITSRGKKLRMFMFYLKDTIQSFLKQIKYQVINININSNKSIYKEIKKKAKIKRCLQKITTIITSKNEKYIIML